MLKGKAAYFLWGALSSGVLLVLLGTGDFGSPNFGPPNYGRYQISACGTHPGRAAAGVGVFIVDTATGETKMVYSKVYGAAETGQTVKDDLGRPFHAIR